MAALPRSHGLDSRAAALVGITAVAALALGALLIGAAPDATRLPAGGRAVPVLVVIIGWAFAGVGCFGWVRRPDNPTGALLSAFGVVVLGSGLYVSDQRLPYLVSTLADPLAIAVFIHLLLAFPSGRLRGRAARLVVPASYAVAALPWVATVLFDSALGANDCSDCPRNLLLVQHDAGVATAARTFHQLAALGLVAVALVLVALRWRSANSFQRRGFAPLLAAGGLILACGIASAAAQELGASAGTQKAAQLFFIATFATLPAAFVVGLVRTRFFRTASVTRLIERLTAERGPGGVRDALASALGDPTLTVAYWLPDEREYVDGSGQPVAIPELGSRRTHTEIEHHGRRIGALVHDQALSEDAKLMAAAGGAAALALENDRLEVELRARLEALRRSRQRIVETGDAERRRLTRDLHDGAQQRLVTLMIELQLADQRLADSPEEARDHVREALGNARAAVAELRELAAGIHPAVLSQRGLAAAVESLAARAAVAVELDVHLPERLPEAVETAAYFVVAEALTNVAKYARASHAVVAIRREGATVLVEVADDGPGGADPAAGTGLRGLGDRIGALGGALEIDSPAGGGSAVRARLPVSPQP
jgi:signal transduction histidine kinase